VFGRDRAGRLHASDNSDCRAGIERRRQESSVFSVHQFFGTLHFVFEGRSAFATSSESATEGALVVRDTCFGAALPCASRAYAFSAAASAGAAVATMKTAAVVTISGGVKIPSVSVDEYSAAPISADGRYAAFYAPGTVAAQPASGVGDVYISIALF
jgi:hypothetical protein